MKNSLTDHCPVCGMMVDSAQRTVQYHKMTFYFCSGQCRETFEATPKLYASGAVEKRAPVIKHRKLYLTGLRDSDNTPLIEMHMKAMMGVTEARLRGNCLSIRYDLLQVTQARIEQALKELAVELGTGWWRRMRRAWVHNAEENELSNLARGREVCCHRPPPRV